MEICRTTGLLEFLRRSLQLGWQRQGTGVTGPIAAALARMSETGLNGQPKSPVGAELAGLIERRGVWVLFAPTQGSGITPVQGLIMLDTGYEGEGQGSSEARVGLVAHELTHVLQRDLDDPQYWPSGFPRPNPNTRWLFDSTNYMEALSYIIGSIVEHDLEAARLQQGGLPVGVLSQLQVRMAQLEEFLATLTSGDPRLATAFVVQMYPTNPFYMQNFQAEARIPDGRIPPGGWDHWLLRFGFSAGSVEHIRSVAARANAIPVDKATLSKLARAGQMGTFAAGLRLPAFSSGFMALYLGARLLLDHYLATLPAWARALAPLLDWSGWLGIGALVASLGSPEGAGPPDDERSHQKLTHPKSLAIVGGGSVVGFAAGLLLKLKGSLSVGPIGLTLDLGSLSGETLALVAFGLGMFHGTIGKTAGRLLETSQAGMLVGLRSLEELRQDVIRVARGFRGGRAASR